VTEDQSLVRELVEQGTITEEEAETHPQRNVVSQALGTNEEVEPDFYDVSLTDGVLLFCSDGLTEEVDDGKIAEVVGSSGSLEEAGDALVERANENGGSDNISVALARRG
jgi:protein phosphatase